MEGRPAQNQGSSRLWITSARNPRFLAIAAFAMGLAWFGLVFLAYGAILDTIGGSVAARSLHLRLALPSTVKPKILSRVLPNQAFQGRRVALGEDANVVGCSEKLGRFDHILAAELISKPGPDAPRDPDDDWGSVLDGQ